MSGFRPVQSKHRALFGGVPTAQRAQSGSTVEEYGVGGTTMYRIRDASIRCAIAEKRRMMLIFATKYMCQDMQRYCQKLQPRVCRLPFESFGSGLSQSAWKAQRPIGSPFKCVRRSCHYFRRCMQRAPELSSFLENTFHPGRRVCPNPDDSSVPSTVPV